MSRRSSVSRRPESRKEHVMFADELAAELHSPSKDDLTRVESILHNREEPPLVDFEKGQDVKNSFEETQPLDDLQLVRRKSLQLTPQSSHKGSRSDVNEEEDEEEEEEGNAGLVHANVLAEENARLRRETRELRAQLDEALEEKDGLEQRLSSLSLGEEDEQRALRAALSQLRPDLFPKASDEDMGILQKLIDQQTK